MAENKKGESWFSKLKVVDLFGQYVTFTHEREFTFNSELGGLATIIMIVLVAIFGLGKLVDVSNHQIESLNENEKWVNLSSE